MVIKKSSVFVVGLVTFSRVALAAGIYTEGDVKASPMPSGNTWSTTNSVFVGDVSSGLVRVSTGQQWNLTSADGHASHLGELPAATGTVEINGGVWNCGQELHCGYNGTGHILIDSGGAWSAGTKAVAFGYSSLASGSLDLKNGSWNSGTFGAYIGHEGRGEITVGANGSWTSQSPVVLGYKASGVGDVTLNGGRWNASSGTVYVGDQGSGVVNINSGASWDAAGQDVHLGEFPNSHGTVSISGASTWNAGDLIIAGGGTGSVLIDSGSSLNAGMIYVGYTNGASGYLTVTNGSHLVCSTSLVFGVEGYGQVDVTDGSTLETRLAWVGSWGGDGLINVSGGSTWISHNTTVIGPMFGAEGAMHFVFIKDSEWKIENDVLFYGLIGNAIFLENGILSSPTHASIRMNFLDDIYGYGTVSNLTISGGNVEVGPAFDDAPGILTLQDVSFVSTNKTKLKLAVWANGSCDQLVFDDSVDFSGADIVIEFADDIAPPNGMEFTLFNYTGTGSSPLNMNNVTAPEGWALDPSGVFAEKFCKITSFAVDRAAQTAQMNFCVNPSGGNWILQSTTNLVQPDWQDVHELTKCARSNLLSSSVNGNQLYWRMVKKEDAPPPPPQPPAGMVLIPAGTNSGPNPDYGEISLAVTNSFYMDATETTKAQWDTVYDWAVANGYSFDNAGSGKAANHPVQTVNWYDCVKWCNARSQMEGKMPCYTVSGSVYKTGRSAPDCNVSVNGYRLPTGVEWEYAARGGLSGKRFPWGDTITHSQANYKSSSSYSYDISSTRGYHPDYVDGGYPYTSPAGSFAANGYGLYDMSGNVWEWCWDKSGSSRSRWGGAWAEYAYYARCFLAIWGLPGNASYYSGFRSVCR